jgi:hypothetical protein
MIFLYTLLVVLLGATHLLIKRRAAALEKKFVHVTKEADEVLRQPGYRPGNASRPDPYYAAKRQYQLALLAGKRDRVESRYTTWQDRADKLGKLRNRLRAWKGRKLPYTFGVLDVAGALALIDYLGAGRYVNARPLVQAVTALFTR